MQPDQATGYKVWAVDGVVYGPVDFATLIEWVKDERVVTDTWIYIEKNDAWLKAGQIPDLRPCFKREALSSTAIAISVVRPGALRRVKVLAELSDKQLERFAQIMEVKKVKQFEVIVKQGAPGDAMYLVLDGELRAKMEIDGKETTLTNLPAGEFFGEMSLFDGGPRSADVVAHSDSTLLKISVANFEKLLVRAPELAAPFLDAVAKTLAARIRADNKRFKDSVQFARSVGL